MLSSYQNLEHARRLINGFRFGFSLHFTGDRVPLQARNLRSARDYKSVLLKKLQVEIELRRIVGPFGSPIRQLQMFAYNFFV